MLYNECSCAVDDTGDVAVTVSTCWTTVADAAALMRCDNVMMIVALSGYDIQSLNIPSLNEYIGHYAQLMSLKSINNWNFYMAFVLFRVAAIAQGVYKRFTLGQPISCLSVCLSVGQSVAVFMTLSV